MTRVAPFRALRYDASRVDLARVIAPPYDVIADADRHQLYDRDPHNAVALELVRDSGAEAGTDYAESRERLAAWQRSGVLVRDPRPAFYALRQRFKGPDGVERERVACFGLLRLEDYATGNVRPHERTLAAPKADRLKLLRATRANLSSVLLLFEDEADRLPALLEEGFERDPLARVQDDAGSLHRLARVATAAGLRALGEFLGQRAFVIADGHHRYETALAYRDERRAAGAGEGGPHAYLLACFANALAPGSLLLPIHRLLRRASPGGMDGLAARLPGWTHSRVPVRDAAAIPALLGEHLAPLRDRHAFAADDASGTLHVFSRAREGSETTVQVLHRDVIGGAFGLDEAAVRDGAIEYPKDAAQTARDLRAGRGSVALYLNALAPEDVFRTTAAGQVLPQKSTFFYPKLPTGLVFRLLDEPA